MAHFRMTDRDTAVAIGEFTEMLIEAGRKGLRTADFIVTNRFHGMRTLTEYQVRRILKMIPNVECDDIGGGWIYSHRCWYLRETSERKIE
jgi:hypothetical protein